MLQNTLVIYTIFLKEEFFLTIISFEYFLGAYKSDSDVLVINCFNI